MSETAFSMDDCPGLIGARQLASERLASVVTVRIPVVAGQKASEIVVVGKRLATNKEQGHGRK